MAPIPNYLVKLGNDGQWIWSAVPDPKFTSDWYQKFAPESTPRFLVDLGADYKSLVPENQIWPWKVISIPDLYLDDFHGAQALLDQGWGAISYQWGEFLPSYDADTSGRKCRPVWPSRSPAGDHNLPAAYIPPNVSPDMARAWDWGIPMLREIPILGIKRAIKTMGKRFVWWDGPCLPQKDFSKGFSADLSRDPPYVGAPWLAGDLGDIAGQEVAKQKFVYLKATVGIVWLNQLDWGKPSTLKTILSKIPIIISNEAVRTLLYRDTENVLKTKEGHLAAVVLSNVLRALSGVAPTTIYVPTVMPDAPLYKGPIPNAPLLDLSKFPKPDPSIAAQSTVSNSAPAKDGAPSLTIAGYGGAIETASEMESLIGNFCGLLEKIRQEEPWFRSLWSFQEGRLMKFQAFVDINGRVLSIPGKQYTDTGEPIPFPATRITMDDGTLRDGNLPSIDELSGFATLLAGEISLAYTAAFGSGTARPAIQPLKELWQKRYGFMDEIMRKIISTGILYNSGEAPLELLVAARRTRFPSLFYADEYKAMTGVLGLFKTSGQQDYTMIEENSQGFSKDDAKNKFWHYDTLPKSLFQAMVKRYQWLVLMLAKLPTDSVAHWGAVAMGHFETINPYCENLVIENELMVERKDWNYVLPELTYLPDRDELQLLPAKGSLQGVCINNNSIMKALPVRYIAARKLPPPTPPSPQATPGYWEPGSVLLWRLAAEASSYQDDEWKTGGWAQELKGRVPKMSNSVRAVSVTAEELGGRDKFLFIPFDSLAYNLATDQALPKDPTKLNQRCLLITDLIYGTDGAWLSGTFAGIADVKNITTVPQYWSEIRLKWQKTSQASNAAADLQTANNTVPTIASSTTISNISASQTGQNVGTSTLASSITPQPTVNDSTAVPVSKSNISTPIPASSGAPQSAVSSTNVAPSVTNANTVATAATGTTLTSNAASQPVVPVSANTTVPVSKSNISTPIPASSGAPQSAVSSTNGPPSVTNANTVATAATGTTLTSNAASQPVANVAATTPANTNSIAATTNNNSGTSTTAGISSAAPRSTGVGLASLLGPSVPANSPYPGVQVKTQATVAAEKK